MGRRRKTNTKEEVESSNGVTFSPPVYIQRYIAVTECLEKLLRSKDKGKESHPKALLEVGCAELKMHIYLKNLPEIEKIIFMDIDEPLLQDCKLNLKPFPVEYISKRTTPLVVEAYVGSITEVDTRVLSAEPKIWGVIAIELVEHLYSDVLAGFQESVFGVISPSFVIVTTPNSDFNQVFKLSPGKFRHCDHKFEWSRKEFISWCEEICHQYTGYSYRIEGIGNGPPGTEHLGCVSQMAIFEFKSEANAKTKELDLLLADDIVKPNAWKLIESVEYPFFVDKTPEEEQILRELNYYIQTYLLNRSRLEFYRDEEKKEICYPLTSIQSINSMPNLAKDTEVLRNVLVTGGYTVRQDDSGDLAILLPIPLCDEEVNESEGEVDEAVLQGYASIVPSVRSMSDVPGLTQGGSSLEEEW